MSFRSDESSAISSSSQEVAIPILSLKLNKGYTILNLITFYYASIVNVASLVYINAALPFLLLYFFHIPEDQQGTAVGDMGLYNEISVIATVTLWGSISDKVGRKVIYIIGLLVMSLGIFLHPMTKSYELLILYRVIFAIGAAASVSMLTALLGDIPTNDSRGRAGGVLGVTSGLGALLGLFGFLQIPKWVSLGYTIANGQIMYWCIGGWLAISSVILGVGLSNKIRKGNEHVSYWTILTKGTMAARNPKIFLSYVSSFVARGDSVVLTGLLSLWITQYEKAHGATPEHALSRAGTISGICQLVALLSAPLFGFLSDRLDRIICQTVAALVATIGYLFLFFIENPDSFLIFLAISIVGIGEIGMVVSSQVLVASESPKDVRGAISGFFSLTGSISVLVSTKLGGYLFDNWKPTGPFFLVAMYNVLVLLFGGFLYYTTDRTTIKYTAIID